MKNTSKKIMSVLVALIFAFVVTACNGSKSPAKQLEEAVDNLSIIYLGGDNQDSVTSAVVLTAHGLNGTTVTWTSSDTATLSASTGVASRLAVGTTKDVTLTAAVSIQDGDYTLTKDKEFVLKVVGTNLMSYDEIVSELIDGIYADADAEVRLKILAAMEKYLIDSQISIPLFSNSSAVLFSERVSLPTGEYLPVLGFNIMQSTLTSPDPGTTSTYTYRNTASGFPATLNHLAYADSAESDVLSLIMGALFEFDYNDDKTGFVLENSMASSVEPLDDGWVEGGTSKLWKITLRDDIYWQAGSYAGNVTVAANTAITAADFLFTYQQLLEPKFAFRRANLLYGDSFPVVGAEDYYKQTADKPVSWDEVGIKAVDGEPQSFTIELSRAISEFNFKYNMSSFVLSPVHQGLFNALSTRTGENWTTTYGSALNSVVGHGAFKLTTWTDKQTLAYEKNASYYNASKYSFTNITTTYVVDANASLALFNSGAVDVTGVPASEYDNYKDRDDLLAVPGSTVFRLSINTATQEELDLQTGGTWQTKPILRELAFREALYFAIDRQTLATEVGKVWTPAQYYFSTAYSHDAESGLIYRETDEAKAVIADLAPTSNGYSSELAKLKYEQALDSLKAAGLLKDNEVITIEFALFDGTTWETVGAWLKGELEKIFVSSKYPNVKFVADVKYYGGLDVYYEKQMPGTYDVAVAGISGGTLDPYGYLDVFMSNNVSGLFLNPGFHSSIRNIDLEAILSE